MKTNRLINNQHFINSLVFVIFTFAGVGLTHFINNSEKEVISAYGKANTMCSSSTRFDIDFECALYPVAPLLKTNWTNNMNITASDEAKVFFNQGLFFLYGFNHAEAERAFKEGIRLDNDCAMCYWGAALSLGPNINVPMPESQWKDAFDYSRKALDRIDHVSDKEKALIHALTYRYHEEPIEDRSQLDIDYSNEMKYVSSRYREDLDIATLYAESLMDLMPWDYWQEDDSPKPATREIQTLLDYVLEKDEDHPGANHYYIHLAEAVHPEIAVPHADKLTEMAYPSGHLVHMPSHIYIRVGRYNDASVANVNAMQIDEEYIERCNAQGVYPALYYPHNIHFLWFAASMEGRSKVALDAARKLDKKVPYGMVAQVPLIERFKSISIFTLLRFGMWDEVLNEPKPDPHFKYSQAMWHYARGMALAKTGDSQKAQTELNQLKKLSKDENLIAVDNPQFPTVGISEVAINVLTAELEGQKEDIDKKIESLHKAVAAQEGLIYMEPPFFYYPVKQSLGAALIEGGLYNEAEKVFRDDLTDFPANGWSLKGLQQSLEKQGNTDEAKKVGKEFEAAWSESDVEIISSIF